MGITVNNPQSAMGTGTNANIAIYTPPSLTNMILVAIGCFDTDNDPTAPGRAMTFGGVAGTHVVTYDQTSSVEQSTGIYYWLLGSDDTAGAIDFSDDADTRGVGVMAFTLAGAKQQAPEGTPKGGGSTSSPLEHSFTTITDDACVIQGFSEDSVAGSIPVKSQSGQIELINTANSAMAMACSYQLVPTAGAETLGYSDVDDWARAANAIVAFEAADGVVPRMMLMGVGS